MMGSAEGRTVQLEIYHSLYWMGQTLGFVMMAATLGVWRQASSVAGTTIGTQTSWLSILSVMWMQAAARFLLGLSEQLDPHLALPPELRLPAEGPFMWAALAISAASVPALWPIWTTVGRQMVGKRWEGMFAAVGVGLGMVGVLAGSTTGASFLDLCALFTLGFIGVGMMLLSFGPGIGRVGNLTKVRIASAGGIIIAGMFGVAAMADSTLEAAWASGACVLGSLILLVALHARVREISKGRAHTSPLRGMLHALLSWGLLAAVGPLLWEASTKPPGGMYRPYMMALGLLCALFAISWHFRQLNLVVSRYIEQLGRDRARALLMGVKASAFLVDEQERVVDCSKEAEAMAGLPAAQIARRVVWEVLGVEPSGPGEFEFERVSAAGAELAVARAELGDDLAGFSVITARDVTEEKRAKSSLARAAREDELTGLPNRREALARVDVELARIGAEGKLGVLFMDLDHFKNVNDTEGHAAGDELLREVAEVLSKSMQAAGGWIARLGGDEFLGVLPDGGDAECEVAARRCIASMDGSSKAAKGSVGVSVGVAVHPRDGASGLDLIRRADAAMYEAKKNGRGGVSFFGSAMETRLRRRVQVESFAREALKADQGGLSMALQPICALDGTFLGQVEALIRAPGMPGLGAQELVVVAEQSGLIIPLGRWVLRQAAAIQSEASARGLSMTLSINVSAKQFMDDLFWDQFRSMARLGYFPRGIVLEVTETSLMEDQPRAAKLLSEARGLGARIALDDFGAGYSSLSTLKSMPLDKLKLDKSLIDEVPGAIESQRVAQAAIAMADALGLEVVAEGVERPEQAEWLATRGVRSAQGYMFARPLPWTELLDLLTTGKRVFISGENLEK